MLRPLAASMAVFAVEYLSACTASQEEQDMSPSEVDAASRPEIKLGGDGSAIIYFRRKVNLGEGSVAWRDGRRALIDALHEDARRAQTRVLELMRRHGLAPRAQLWMINAVAASLSYDLAEEIARLPEVDHVGPDVEVDRVEPLQLMEAPAAGEIGATIPWNLSAIGVPSLWATGQRGAGVVIATLDTGVDVDHPDLAGSWRSAAGWYDPYGQHERPADLNGHGTMVTGLLVGGDASGEPLGVAPGAQWISARIFDDAGVASLSAMHLALQWVLDPDEDPTTDDAPHIVTASWGYSQHVDECLLEFEPDVAVLRAAQIAHVFAAGNSGPYAASSISPANNPSAFAAGAVDESLSVLSGSARGPSSCTGAIFPEVVAPGANVRTADLTLGGRFPSSYVVVTGTSFSAPHVAGAMALLLGAHPLASVTQLEHALTATAADLSPSGADDQSGFGLLNLGAAEALLGCIMRTPSCSDADGWPHGP